MKLPKKHDASAARAFASWWLDVHQSLGGGAILSDLDRLAGVLCRLAAGAASACLRRCGFAFSSFLRTRGRCRRRRFAPCLREGGVPLAAVNSWRLCCAVRRFLPVGVRWAHRGPRAAADTLDEPPSVVCPSCITSTSLIKMMTATHKGH